ncbi:MAG: pyruvate kinase [Thermoanaerobaculia bacterium]
MSATLVPQAEEARDCGPRRRAAGNPSLPRDAFSDPGTAYNGGAPFGDRMPGRRTKIIVTLGPSTDRPGVLAGLIAAGMDVARLNFSHGSTEEQRRRYREVRDAARTAGRPVAVLQDIQGPKIRVGTFSGGSVALERDRVVTLRAGAEEGDTGTLFVGYEGLTRDLRPGQAVYLADGQVRLEVTEVRHDAVLAVVLSGGTVRDRQGAAFPQSDLRLSPVTDKDREDLAVGRELGVDYVAASFVASRRDVEEVADLAGVPVIAKIERAVAYRDLDSILGACHGAMVARGDLGVELPLEKLPRAQREILAATNRSGRISITATEMLESMTRATRPTRAEVTDIANAVLQGSDAVMLSGETAIGTHPVRVVEAMDAICREVDATPRALEQTRPTFLSAEEPVPSATTQAAVEAAESLELETIVAFTESGNTARLLSKYRPRARVVAFTPVEETWRRMALYRGVRPHRLDRFDSTDEMLARAEERLLADELVTPGETIVMVAGTPPNQRASTNFLKLHRVGSPGGTPH